jgi:hypothetical protein
MWVDAVCIDQYDTQERNHQVKQMRNIYEHATNVLVWLGPPFQGPGGNSLMETVFKRPSLLKVYQRRMRRELLDEICLEMLGNLYWSRMWVLQELLVGEKVTVQYGRSSLDWQAFCGLLNKMLEASSAWMNHVRYLGGRYRTLVQLRAQCESSFGRHLNLEYGMLNLLYDFADNKFSSDDRDKVFALLGLLSPDKALITPDYSLNVQDVFKDTARAWIDKYESLLIIALVDGCHLTALGPLSSCIYITSSPSTLYRPYIYPYFTVTMGHYHSGYMVPRLVKLPQQLGRLFLGRKHYSQQSSCAAMERSFLCFRRPSCREM